MKKILLNIFILIVALLTINSVYSFEVKQVSREEIDKIKCDLNFTWKLEKWFWYTFNDTFINNSWRDVKVIESEVNIYEEEDFNLSDSFSEVNFSKWALDKNNIFKPWDRWIITELNGKYRISKLPKEFKQDNFIIKYTLWLYYKWEDWKFSDWPYFHTECKQYKIFWEREKIKKNTSLIILPKILPKTWTPISDRVIKKTNPKLNVDLIESRFKLAGNYNSDINFWLKALDKKDINKDKYLVIPSNGLVVPINSIKEWVKDYNELISWKEINYNKYLKTGSLEYSWTSVNWYWEEWNKVILWHSSYWKDDDGRYKTDFWKIIELDVWEEIWIYVKKNWKFTRFKYQTVASYNTNPENVWVLKPWEWKNLTLFTCTPIGWIKWRWIIKAKYIENEEIRLENKKDFKNIELKIKIKINNIIKKLSRTKNWKETILKIYNSIIKKEKQISDLKETKKTIFIKDILEYLKYKLSQEYYK